MGSQKPKRRRPKKRKKKLEQLTETFDSPEKNLANHANGADLLPVSAKTIPGAKKESTDLFIPVRIIQTAKKLLSKRWAFAFVAFFILATSLSAFFYLTKSEATTIRGRFSQLGNIEFVYDKFQIEGVSPLCGCYKEMPPETWRGITFAARYLHLERKGKLPLTQFIITAPEPTNTFWSTSAFKIGIGLHSLTIPEDAEFDPRALISGELPSDYTMVSKQDLIPETFYLLFSQNELNVAMLGDKPLGAWVPADGSTIRLRHEKKMRLSTPIESSLLEIYHPYRLSYEMENLQGLGMGLPLGDFLGPNVVVWWHSDSSSTIVSRGNSFEVRGSKEPGKRAVTAMVINPAFSVRIALNAARHEDVSSTIKYVKEHRNDDSLPPTNYRDSGEVLLSILNPNEQVADFNEIYRQLKQNELTTAYNIPTDERVYGRNKISMTFRYPAIPPNNGFNIFGPIKNLTAGSAVGSVLIGYRQHTLITPSQLELRHVESLSIEGGIIPVPIKVTTADHDQSDLELQAKSEIYINGESINERAEHFRFGEHLTTISLVVSVLSGIVSIVSFVLARKRSIPNVKTARGVKP